MKKYARIDSGKVVEIIETDGDIAKLFHSALVANMVDVSGIAGVKQGWDWDGLNATEPLAPPPQVPQSVSPFQARKALKQSGLLATVQGAVAAADEDTQMAWEYATSFDRNSEFVLGMAAGLGWTDEQVDNLFILANSL